MTIEPDTTRMVEVKVLGVEIHKGKPMVKLEVPAWGSKYPIPIYGTTPEEQEILAIGETMKVELKADRQKEDSDGSKPWMYFWSFVRKLSDGELADVEVARVKPSEQQPEQEQPQPWQVRQAQAKQTAMASTQDKDTAIRRAVALKAAVDLHGNGERYEGANLAEVLEVADTFEKWLRGEEA